VGAPAAAGSGPPGDARAPDDPERSGSSESRESQDSEQTTS